MTTRHQSFYTTVWTPEELTFINCYGHWNQFVTNVDHLPDRFVLGDHMYGFQQDGSNCVLDVLEQHSQKTGRVWTMITDQIFPKKIHDRYPCIKFEFKLGLFERYGATVRMPPRHEYVIHPDINFQNFLCSFNGKSAVSRVLLLSALKKRNWFDPKYVSKHVVWTLDSIDGLIKDFVADEDALYRKFFDVDDEEFASSTNSFGYERGRHDVNIYNLEHKLTQSFVHVVSETIATSSVAFVTEKAFYSLITHGLFITYGPPGWNFYFSEIFGFKPYSRLFDYRHDTTENPVKRLVEILCMLSKYSNLSYLDWHDLHEIESDAIDFNYDHFRSGDYIRSLDRFSQENVYY